MQIERITIKNFKTFRDVEIRNLPSMCVFLGANGSGKSTLFDVFGFLSDALRNNVRTALSVRGGFKEVISRGVENEPIEISIKFRNDIEIENGKKPPPITYELSVGLDEKGFPVVERELLRYRRGQTGSPWKFLDFSRGTGEAIVNEDEYGRGAEAQREAQTLDSPDILAIKGLGQFQKFKAIASFRRLLENWYVSNFQIQAARSLPDVGVSEHLSTAGDNLALVAKYMFEHYREEFDRVLQKMAARVPGISNVQATETDDGRVVLKFQDGAFKDPFISRYVSDGTIRMFAYLLLLHDPKPHPLLCVEEPENYLHPDLLKELAEEFRDYARRGGQVFISTHSPEFANALELKELFWLTKQNGFTTIHRADEDSTAKSLYEEGDLPGALWMQRYFRGSGPNH